MPEIIDDKKVFSLLELGESIQRMFDSHYAKRYWVKAEMHKLNLYGRSGHCFPDLVEKKNGQVIAEMRGNMWKSDYQRIDREFVKALGEPLKEGIKILFSTAVKYHPRYGLTLHIIDIDVNYTLGDLAKERKETVRRLNAEGILNANKLLPTPMLPKRIAVISVETSNGYMDFLKVIDGNPYGYKIEHTLFPSLLQGDRAVGAMVKQLKKIAKRKDDFDLVAIIRGGGGDIGLSFLNKYDIAKEVATFPIPVVTGIGHATNQTVVETIAHKDAITPTEMAEWLIHRYRLLDQSLDAATRTMRAIPMEILFGARRELETTLRLLRSEGRRGIASHRSQLNHSDKRLAGSVKRRTQEESTGLLRVQEGLKTKVSAGLSARTVDLETLTAHLTKEAKGVLTQATEELSRRESILKILDPKQVLKRGYSISRVDGKAVHDAAGLKKGAILTTQFYTGSATSKVEEIQSRDGEE